MAPLAPGNPQSVNKPAFMLLGAMLFVADGALAWAWGYGAQFALGVPSLQLAVATAATDPHPRDLRAQNTAVMAVVAQVVAAVGQA